MLKLVGGPRDGGTYSPGRWEPFDEERLAYRKEDGSTGIAVYRRRKMVTPQKTIRFTDEMEFVRYHE